MTRTLPTSAINTIRTTQRTFNLICSFIKICTFMFFQLSRLWSPMKINLSMENNIFLFQSFKTFTTQLIKNNISLYLSSVLSMRLFLTSHATFKLHQYSVSISNLSMKSSYESCLCGMIRVYYWIYYFQQFEVGVKIE